MMNFPLTHTHTEQRVAAPIVLAQPVKQTYTHIKSSLWTCLFCQWRHRWYRCVSVSDSSERYSRTCETHPDCPNQVLPNIKACKADLRSQTHRNTLFSVGKRAHAGEIFPSFNMSLRKDREGHLPRRFLLFLFRARLSSFFSSSPMLIWRTSRRGSWKCQMAARRNTATYDCTADLLINYIHFKVKWKIKHSNCLLALLDHQVSEYINEKHLFCPC